jgi:HEPN domain-containing protein
MSPDLSGAERWLALARADLAVARSVDREDELQRGLACFHCQQAAEKSLKAVLVHAGVAFPWTHNLTQLVALVESTTERSAPDEVRAARMLSDYATAMRYPDAIGVATSAALDEALALAAGVVAWAASVTP